MRNLIWVLPALLLGFWLWFGTLGGGPEAAADAETASQGDVVLDPQQATSELVGLPTEARTSERTEVAPDSLVPAKTRTEGIPVANLLNGIVQGPNGKPSPNTLVGMAELDDERGPKSRGGRALTESDDQGRFELQVPKWALGQEVLLVARRSDSRPASKVLRLTPTVLQAAHTLDLRAGSQVWGQVIRDGQPVVGAGAFVDVKYRTPGVFGLGEEAWWAGGSLENKIGSADVDDAGVFRIPGMGAGEFRLAFAIPGREISTTMSHVYSIRSEEYTVYDITPATMSLTVRDALGPVVGAQVHVTGREIRRSFKSSAGPTLIEVDPAETLHFQVLSRGHKPLVIPFHQPPARAGIRNLELFLGTRVRPSLSIRLPGAQAAGVDWISLRLFPVQENGLPARSAADSLHLKRADGLDIFQASVVDLDPGEYQVLMGGTAQDPTWFPLVGQTRSILLAEAGEHYIDFELQWMASFDVTGEAPSPDEENVDMHMRILDADGEVLTQCDAGTDGSYYFDEDDEEFADSIWSDGVEYRRSEERHRGAPGPIAPPPTGAWGWLPAGTYTLEVRADGHKTIRRSITLAAGIENDISITLQKVAGD